MTDKPEPKRRSNQGNQMKRISLMMKKQGILRYTSPELTIELSPEALAPEPNKKRFDPDAIVFESNRSVYDAIVDSDEFAAFEISGVITGGSR